MTTPIRWTTVLAEGARIVNSYTTRVTLRQLHYRLVAASVGGYVNTESAYKRLSALTAEARAAGTFPLLADTGRSAEQPQWWLNPAEALSDIADAYRRNRTEDQKFLVWMIYEKATLSAQLESWTRPYGIPTAALRGYSSESLEQEVFQWMIHDGRPVVVFYLGDLDPEGEDIERNFIAQAKRAGIDFHHWERLGVTTAQVAALGLVPRPGKATSSRAAGFTAKHGSLFQIELEAIDPAELERLITEAVVRPDYHDEAAYEALLAVEKGEKERLAELARDWS